MNGCVCELPRNENFLIQIVSWFRHLNFNYPVGGGKRWRPWQRRVSVTCHPDTSHAEATTTIWMSKLKRNLRTRDVNSGRECHAWVDAAQGAMRNEACLAELNTFSFPYPMQSTYTNLSLPLFISLYSLQLHHQPRLAAASARRNWMSAFVACSHRLCRS